MKKTTNGAVGSENNHFSHTLASTKHPDWFKELERLARLEKSLAFLPVGWGSDGKAPMLKAWPSHPGFTTKQLSGVRGIRSVGAKTGIRGGKLLCFDIDGISALEFGCSIGMEPWAVTTWQVHRDNDPFRLKVLFRLTLEQIAQLPGGKGFQGKTVTQAGDGSRKGEAMEVFFDGGRQVIVLGEHPSSSGNYIWPGGLGPENLTNAPDSWWQHALEIAVKAQRRCQTSTKPSARRNGTRRLDPCPICGRCSDSKSGLWCEETSEGLILCMPGSTYNADPSGTMTIGTVVNGYTLVKRTPLDVGDCLTFAQHRPLTPRHRIRRPQRSFRSRADVQA
jgi:hypothetical protein